MDLVLKDAGGTDLMVISPDSADFAWGRDENDFELRFSDSPRRPGFVRYGYVYAYGTEYGGLLTRMSSEDGVVTWGGVTWTGLLKHKVLVPDSGSDHLTVSGDLNAVLAQLVARVGLSSVMSAGGSRSGISVSSYKFPLYVDAYSGITGMLGSVGAKLVIRHNGDHAVLSAVRAKDWSSDEEFDSDLVNVFVDVDHLPVNHLVARGEDEGQNRIAVELYLDGSGNVSQSRTFSGVLENSEYYNFNNADLDTLVEYGTERLKDYWDESKSVSVSINAEDARFDIGDTVGGIDSRTGISASAKVTKKVLTIDMYGIAKVSYETS